MQQFKFELASLLEFRQQEEQTAKQAYAVAQQGVQQAQAMIKTLLQEKHKIFGYATNNVKLLQAQRQYLSVIEQRLVTAQAQESICQQSVAEALAGLSSKQQARQVIERLYAKKFAQYQVELRRQEQNFLDELGTQNFMRKQID